MPRGVKGSGTRKTLTAAEKVAKLTADIQKKQDQLKKLKRELKIQQRLAKNDNISNLTVMIEKSGKTQEEIENFLNS